MWLRTLQACVGFMEEDHVSPVLSVQMVVAVPMVSAAPRWRTRLLSFSIRFTL